MKIVIDDLRETFELCLKSGKIKEKNVDIDLIKSLKLVAEKGLDFINSKIKYIPKNSTDWTFVFRENYESLRGLIEAYLLFDGISADNHQCKTAYICNKHPELDLDWDFLETVRLKRNAINYRGILLKFDDWNFFKLNFNLHISILKNEISRKLNESY